MRRDNNSLSENEKSDTSLRSGRSGASSGIPDALTKLALKKVSGAKLVARVAETSGEVGGAGLKDAIPAWYVELRPFFGPPGSLPDPF